MSQKANRAIRPTGPGLCSVPASTSFKSVVSIFQFAGFKNNMNYLVGSVGISHHRKSNIRSSLLFVGSVWLCIWGNHKKTDRHLLASGFLTYCHTLGM
jgi:hypothetical protein